MEEFIYFIRNLGDPVANFSKERQQVHIQKVVSFIQQMVGEGKMKAAQPLQNEGAIVSFKDGKFEEGRINVEEEIISGYYHILANDLDEAIEIAKSDPRFEDGDWRLEIRPILKIKGLN